MLIDNAAAIERAKVCAGCDRLFRATWTCKECGCFMKVKTRLASASCPIGKWGPADE